LLAERRHIFFNVIFCLVGILILDGISLFFCVIRVKIILIETILEKAIKYLWSLRETLILANSRAHKSHESLLRHPPAPTRSKKKKQATGDDENKIKMKQH
jgi:hypothetical protein